MALDYASKGVAGSGLGLGIAGTALGVLNSGGLLGGLFGSRSNGNCVTGLDCMNTLVTQNQLNEVLCYQNQLSAKDAQLSRAESEVAMLKVSKETDQKISDTYQNIIGIVRSENEKLQQQIRANELRINNLDVNMQRVTDGLDRVFDTLNQKIDCCCKEMNAAINLEAERRNCADQRIVSYVNNTFQPNVVIREGTGDVALTAQGQSEVTYNPLCNCQCN